MGKKVFYALLLAMLATGLALAAEPKTFVFESGMGPISSEMQTRYQALVEEANLKQADPNRAVVMKLPTIILGKGVDVNAVKKHLLHFNPVDLEGLDSILFVNDRTTTVAHQNQGLYGEYAMTPSRITIYRTDEQLNKNEGLLLRTTLLHELAHHASIMNGENSGGRGGVLDEGRVDTWVKTLHHCADFSEILTE